MDEPDMKDEPEPANTLRAGKRAPTKTSWKKGVSGNPAGRKPSGQSWAEILREMSDKSADELAAVVGGPSNWMGAILESYPAGVPIKHLVATRVLVALMVSPSAGLLNRIMGSDALAALEERLAVLEQDAAERRDRDEQ